MIYEVRINANGYMIIVPDVSAENATEAIDKAIVDLKEDKLIGKRLPKNAENWAKTVQKPQRR